MSLWPLDCAGAAASPGRSAGSIRCRTRPSGGIHEGKRYEVTATNTPSGQVQFLEARHRTQARVEENIKAPA